MCPSHSYILHFTAASLIEFVFAPSEYLYICIYLYVCAYMDGVCERQGCLATGFTT